MLSRSPDKNKDNVQEASEKFKKISEAYSVLSDAQVRSAPCEKKDPYAREPPLHVTQSAAKKCRARVSVCVCVVCERTCARPISARAHARSRATATRHYPPVLQKRREYDSGAYFRSFGGAGGAARHVPSCCSKAARQTHVAPVRPSSPTTPSSSSFAEVGRVTR